MNVLHGLLMGILQGLTEFLPISSSGHLSLYQYFTGTQGESGMLFSLMLHLGTLAAVIAAYYEDLWAMIKEIGYMIRELSRGEFAFRTQRPERRLLYMLFVGCLPLVLALLLNIPADYISSDNDIILEGVFFLFTALMLFLACRARRGKAGIMKMRTKHALAIGVMQSVATMPGISRSGATISTGMLMGFDRAFMVKYSFLLGIPTILGGVVFKLGDAAKSDTEIAFWPVFVGMLAAAVVGYLSIRLIRWLLLSDKFVIFAWYTLVLGALVIVLGIIGHIAGWGGGEADASGASSAISQAVSDISSSSAVPA